MFTLRRFSDERNAVSTKRYLATRVIGFAVQGALLAYNIKREMFKENVSPVVWFAYLSQLNLLLTVTYETAAGLNVFVSRRNNRPLKHEEFPVLRDSALTTSLCVSLLYWGVDRSGDLQSGLLFHMGSTLALLAEILANKLTYAPTILSSRFATPVLGAALYVATEGLLTVHAGLRDSNGDALYKKVLDWNNNPESALMWGGIGTSMFALIPGGFRILKNKITSYFQTASAKEEDEDDSYYELHEPIRPSRSWCSMFSSCCFKKKNSIVLNDAFDEEVIADMQTRRSYK